MHVKVVDNELYDDNRDVQSSTCFTFASNPGTSPKLNNGTQRQKMLNSNFKKQQNQNEQHQFNKQQQTLKMLISKDLVGNSKEFRIENNKYNLRIIGNDNRIRIRQNSGNLQIIGNNTRLKITKNNGNIKYTGNEGRISLGSESEQQMVDYIGCNGLLKVVDSMELNKSPKCTVNNNSRRKTMIVSDKVNNSSSEQVNLLGNATAGTSPNSSSSTSMAFSEASTCLGPRVKSASFDGLIETKEENFQEFNNFLHSEGWHHFAKASLPNLKENYNESYVCDCKCKKNQNRSFTNKLHKKNNSQNNSTSNRNTGTRPININDHTNVAENVNDIVIKNSVNVSIG